LDCEGRHARNDVGSVTTGSNHPAQLLLDPASQRDQGQHGQGGVEPAQLSPASPSATYSRAGQWPAGSSGGWGQACGYRWITMQVRVRVTPSTTLNAEDDQPA
jgi:hypothetical protein